MSPHPITEKGFAAWEKGIWFCWGKINERRYPYPGIEKENVMRTWNMVCRRKI